MCEAIPRSSVRNSELKKVDRQDRSESGCCVFDAFSTACWPCHKWLQRKTFEGHLIAAENVQDGSLLQTSEVRDLVRCEERGCQLCSTILCSIRLQIKVEFPKHEPLSDLARCRLYLLPDVPGWTIKTVLEAPSEFLHTDIRLVSCDSKSENKRVLDLTGVDDGKTRMCFQKPHESCAYRLASQCVVEQIKAWLEECKCSHHSCWSRREGYDTQGQTFRLLLLGDEQNPHTRLVDVDTSSKAEYITVSHRWDSSTKATETTQTNISSAYQNISVDAYPRHFRDIMSLTRRLGFKYIWIDSLCIIQDSREDWSKQATLMHRIYSNGTLNFALLEDFAHQEPPGQAYSNAEVLGCNLKILGDGESHREVICWKPENFDYVLQTSRLYSRGWTFQERLLSPRTIHFGKQLYWECCFWRASTTFPQTVDYPGQFPNDFVLRFKQLIPNQTQNVAGNLHRLWCSVIRDYSGRDFTRPSDRLIALSGVAERLQYIYSLGNDDYLYGLWKPCLPEQLLWAVEGSQRASLDQTNAGPSWSWASHMHSTRFVNMYLGTEFLRQRLATFVGFRNVEAKTLSVNLNASSSSASAIMSLKGILIPSGYNASTAVVIEADCPTYELRSSTYLLPILGDIGTIYGLVLQPASIEGDVNHNDSTFRRLGIFQGQQIIIEDILYAQQPSLESSLDWATLLHLQGCIVNLIS